MCGSSESPRSKASKSFTLRKRAATPCPWSRLHRAGFATIHRRTWRPVIAGRPRVVRDRFPLFERGPEQFRNLLHRVEEFRPVCHDQQRPEEFSQVWCRSCLARQERQYRERQKPLGPWYRCWQTRAFAGARQNWPSAASDPRPGYRGRPCRSADRWRCRVCPVSWSGTLSIVAPSHRLRKIEATERTSGLRPAATRRSSPRIYASADAR